MANLTRRGFLGALAAAGATVAAAPAFAAVEHIDGRFRLIGKRLVLDRPLVLKGLRNFEVRDCVILASENFVGESLIIAEDCEGGVIANCVLDFSSAGLDLYSVWTINP